MAIEGQQHPIKIYVAIWLLLFVFSFFSYLVDYINLQGMLRWSLIILFMLLKAGFIVAIFMHMKWERFALLFAILLPPIALLFLIYLMYLESGYAWATRVQYMGDNPSPERISPHHASEHHDEQEDVH